jgi:membrane associated rhomboid family serine protease
MLLSSQATAIVLAFIFQGVFMVAGLNALRARIGQTEQGKGNAYGVFYLGTALAMGLGNVVIGQIWEHFNSNTALTFSASGLILLLLAVSLMKSGLLPQPSR